MYYGLVGYVGCYYQCDVLGREEDVDFELGWETADRA